MCQKNHEVSLSWLYSSINISACLQLFFSGLSNILRNKSLLIHMYSQISSQLVEAMTISLSLVVLLACTRASECRSQSELHVYIRTTNSTDCYSVRYVSW
jgi:hypothetical protein